MKIIQLRCFVILSETLNFSHTAEIMHLTQPDVSHQIKKLESLLNFQLFTRNKQTVELTEAGRQFYHDMREVLAHLSLAINNASSISQGNAQVIKISYAGLDLERYHLPLIINQIKSRLAKTDVMVTMSAPAEQRKALLSQKVQMILTPLDNIENSEGVVYQEIVASGIDCVVPAGHPLRQRNCVTLEELAQERLYLPDPATSPRALSAFVARLHKKLPDCQYHYVDSAVSANILIQSHSGIALLPAFAKSLDTRLYRIPLDTDTRLSYGIAWLKENASVDIRLCANIIQQHLRRAY